MNLRQRRRAIDFVYYHTSWRIFKNTSVVGFLSRDLLLSINWSRLWKILLTALYGSLKNKALLGLNSYKFAYATLELTTYSTNKKLKASFPLSRALVQKINSFVRLPCRLPYYLVACRQTLQFFQNNYHNGKIRSRVFKRVWYLLIS